MTNPLLPSGSDFPCKGFLTDIGTPAGTPTASWPAGSPQQLSLTGGAAHNGGSCQLSLSYDGGKTFKVIKSIEGGCVRPAGGDHSFDFTVPADAKPGDAVFAWTWFNNTGNREMYMNCAAVTITGGGSSDLAGNPDMFVANVGNGCTVPEGTDVKFPNGGSDVQVISEAKLGAPTGSCGASGPSAPAAASSAASPASPSAASSSAAGPVAPSAASSSAAGSVTSPVASSSAATPVAPPVASSSAVASAASSAASSSAAAPSAVAAGSYTVKTGDACDTIATQNGITVAQLLQNNPSVYVSALLHLDLVNSLFCFSLAATLVAPTSRPANPSISASAPASCASSTERFHPKAAPFS